MEAKQRSIGAIMCGIESFGGPALDRDIGDGAKRSCTKGLSGLISQVSTLIDKITLKQCNTNTSIYYGITSFQ